MRSYSQPQKVMMYEIEEKKKSVLALNDHSVVTQQQLIEQVSRSSLDDSESSPGWKQESLRVTTHRKTRGPLRVPCEFPVGRKRIRSGNWKLFADFQKPRDAGATRFANAFHEAVSSRVQGCLSANGNKIKINPSEII